MAGWTVEVVDAREVGPGVVALELESPPGFCGRPGQFVLVRETVDGEAVGRHYTISSPDTDGTFEITVEADPAGTLSRWLAARSPGDSLRIEGPLGRVYYGDEDPVVVVAGGPGVGAAVGVGERAVADGHEATIVYHGPLAHEARLAALSAAGASVFVVSDRLAAAVAGAFDRGAVYVFGFRDFIDAVRDAIEATGGDPDAAKYENYGPRP